MDYTLISGPDNFWKYLYTTGLILIIFPMYFEYNLYYKMQLHEIDEKMTNLFLESQKDIFSSMTTDEKLYSLKNQKEALLKIIEDKEKLVLESSSVLYSSWIQFLSIAIGLFLTLYGGKKWYDYTMVIYNLNLKSLEAKKPD